MEKGGNLWGGEIIFHWGEACRTRASVVLCHSHEGDLEGEEFTGQNQVPKSDCLLKFGSFGHLGAFYSFFCRPLHLAVDWCHLALLEATPSGLGCPQGVEGSFLPSDGTDLI